MFLIQDIQDTQSFKAGYEVGKWIYHNSILSIVIGVVLSVGFVWLLTKVVKQIRTFGE
jgi:hypothetical protein